MFHILKNRATHAGRLERWLGRDECERISAGMGPWYGPDIAVAGVPGLVYARKGGDFVGQIDGGWFSNLRDTADAMARRWRTSMNAGFSDLADLQFEATKGGKSRVFTFSKTSTGGTSGRWGDRWASGNYPATGSAGAAAPSGTAWTDASTGAWPFNNPDTGDRQYFVQGEYGHDAAGGGAVMLYDRLFSVAKTMNSTATEAVTGVPTRYQSTTSTDDDYAAGNFLFPTVISTIAATAHNWTVCTYTDQGGNAGTVPSIAGVSGAATNTVDLAGPNWFMPLATGDVGVQTLTQMQCDALVATGTLDFAIGHPIAWLPSPTNQNVIGVINGINSAFQITRIFDDAALSLLSAFNGGSAILNGSFQTVSG